MKLKRILPIIGIVLLIYLIYDIGFSKIINAVKGADIYYLIFGVVLTPIFVLPLAFKWHRILKKQGFNLNFLYVLKIYYIGAFYGFITPSRAGSLMRAYYLKNKTKRKLVECASGIVAERIMDLFSVFIFAFLGVIFIIKSNFNLKPILIISFLVFFTLIWIFMRKKRAMFLLGLLYRHLVPEHIKDKTDNSLNTFYDSLPKLRKLASIFLLTIFSWIFLYLQTFIFAKAFHITSIPFYIFVSLISIGTVVATIPISVSGLGTRELTLINLFGLFNVNPEAVVSMSLISFIAVGLIESSIGLFFMLKENKNETKND
ncbi:flippase-like domain-containing protein [Candidatus Woesearchaeota archaeon]|nr:flippase-like domain-containing protein [Candidatus Woesearchaeota archaeon]